MFQKAGNRRNERTNVMEGEGGKDESGRKSRRGREARRKGSEKDGEGVGGHLRKQMRQKTKIDRNKGEEEEREELWEEGRSEKTNRRKSKVVEGMEAR